MHQIYFIKNYKTNIVTKITTAVGISNQNANTNGPLSIARIWREIPVPTFDEETKFLYFSDLTRVRRVSHPTINSISSTNSNSTLIFNVQGEGFCELDPTQNSLNICS